jgi:SOS-response transcriptional repressor LexA
MKATELQPLTPAEGGVFDLIVRGIREDGRPPAIREIMKSMGWASPNAVVGHLGHMRRKGWISPPEPAVEATRSTRAIRVAAGVPCVGCDGLGRVRVPEGPENLTGRQRQVFDLILHSVRHRKAAPTLRELADGLGTHCPNGVVNHLLALQRKGWISLGVRMGRRGTARAVRIVAGETCPQCEGLGRIL